MKSVFLYTLMMIVMASTMMTAQESYILSGDFMEADPGQTTLDQIIPQISIVDANDEIVEMLSGSICVDPDHPDAEYAVCFDGPATLAAGQQFRISLSRTDDPQNGVSTLDIVLVQRHILGIVPLDGDGILASDVNLSNSSTALDLVEMRRLILAVTDAFESSISWQFYTTTGTGQAYYYTPSDFPLSDVHFRPIKLGDVNRTSIF